MADNERVLQKLKRTFGANLDEDVLRSVLEITGGNEAEAIAFLQANNNDYAEDAPQNNQGEAIPPGFFDRPPNFEPLQTNEATNEVHTFVEFFLEEGHLFAEHLEKITTNPKLYSSVFLLLLHQRVDLISTTKARVLAAAWNKNRPLAEQLLLFTNDFGLPEILKAVKYLDGPRQYRALSKRLENYRARSVRSSVFGALKGKLHDLEVALELPRTCVRSSNTTTTTTTTSTEATPTHNPPPPLQTGGRRGGRRGGNANANANAGATAARSSEALGPTSWASTNSESLKISLSGSVVKRVQKWLRTIPVEQLVFFALAMPREPWMELCDLVHPSSKDFQAEWFLDFVFSGVTPQGTVIAEAESITTAQEADIKLKEGLQLPYSYLRRKIPGASLSPESRAKIATYEKLATVIWWYEELALAEPNPARAQELVEKIISDRLTSGEEPNQHEMGYGKIMERLLLLKNNNSRLLPQLSKVAQKRLNEYNLPLEPPVRVLGDRSFSMDVAIRTSSILASLFSVLANAELVFFNTEISHPVNGSPRTVDQALQVANDTRTNGLTAPAVVLQQDLVTKNVTRWYVVVSDERENLAVEGEFFAQKYYRYLKEISPRTKIVLVSFLENPREKGRMTRSLEGLGIKLLSLRLDGRRPDLNKTDSLLGILSSETDSFVSKAREISSKLNSPLDYQLPPSVFKLERAIHTQIITSNSAPIAEQNSSNDNKSSSDDTEEAPPHILHDESEKEETPQLCKVCFEKPITTVLLECGHLSFCFECAQKFEFCPFCREKVTRCKRVFQT